MRAAFLAVTALLAAQLQAGSSFFVTFPVQAPAGNNGEGAQAAASAGVTIVRAQIHGEAAFQKAGPDGPGLGRIYTQPSRGSYVLTDAGSQWTTGVAQMQTALAVVEAYAGQFGWQGRAYSGAVTATVSKPDIVDGRLSLAPMLLSEVPAPVLREGDPTRIVMEIPAVLDHSGLATGLQLWRKDALGSWLPKAVLPVSSGVQVFTDAEVQANSAYWYGISVIYGWPGGQGAGALPDRANQYVSWARSESSLMAAALVQPTPTPFPTLVAAIPTPDLGNEPWVAAPNPSRDGKFRLTFHTTKSGTYSFFAYTLDGSLAKTVHATFEQAGWQRPEVDLSKFASGLYLFQLRVKQEGETENTWPLRKVAIVR